MASYHSILPTDGKNCQLCAKIAIIGEILVKCDMMKMGKIENVIMNKMGLYINESTNSLAMLGRNYIKL